MDFSFVKWENARIWYHFFDFVYWGITSFYNDYISTHFSLLAKPQNCKYWEETNKFITTCLFLCLFYQYPYIWRQWQMLEQIQDICICITCTDIIIHLSVSPWYFLLYILVYYTLTQFIFCNMHIYVYKSDSVVLLLILCSFSCSDFRATI